MYKIRVTVAQLLKDGVGYPFLYSWLPCVWSGMDSILGEQLFYEREVGNWLWIHRFINPRYLGFINLW